LALSARRLTPLLAEVHLALLRIVLKDEQLLWESGVKHASWRLRAQLSINKLRSGQWESLFGFVVTYTEGAAFREQLSQLRNTELAAAGVGLLAGAGADASAAGYASATASPLNTPRNGGADGEDVLPEAAAPGPELDGFTSYLEHGWLRECEALLCSVMDEPAAQPFLRPMEETRNMNEEQKASYRAIVQEPMDLGTALAGLRAGKYATLSALDNDLQTIWENANALLDDSSPELSQTRQLFGSWTRACQRSSCNRRVRLRRRAARGGPTRAAWRERQIGAAAGAAARRQPLVLLRRDVGQNVAHRARSRWAACAPAPACSCGCSRARTRRRTRGWSCCPRCPSRRPTCSLSA
jgi:hypothetical protein